MTTEDDFIKKLLAKDNRSLDSLQVHLNLYKRCLKQKDLTEGDKIKILLIVLSFYIQFGYDLDALYLILKRFEEIPTIHHIDRDAITQRMFKNHGITVIHVINLRNYKEDEMGMSLYFSLDGGEIFHIRATSLIENPEILYKTYNVLKDTLDLKG
jgi:hypothetical protein